MVPEDNTKSIDNLCDLHRIALKSDCHRSGETEFTRRSIGEQEGQFGPDDGPALDAAIDRPLLPASDDAVRVLAKSHVLVVELVGPLKHKLPTTQIRSQPNNQDAAFMRNACEPGPHLQLSCVIH